MVFDLTRPRGLVTTQRPNARVWFVILCLSAVTAGCAVKKKMTVVSAASLVEDVGKAILNLPEYYAFFTYSMFSGRVSK